MIKKFSFLSNYFFMYTKCDIIIKIFMKGSIKGKKKKKTTNVWIHQSSFSQISCKAYLY